MIHGQSPYTANDKLQNSSSNEMTRAGAGNTNKEYYIHSHSHIPSSK